MPVRLVGIITRIEWTEIPHLFTSTWIQDAKGKCDQLGV